MPGVAGASSPALTRHGVGWERHVVAVGPSPDRGQSFESFRILPEMPHIDRDLSRFVPSLAQVAGHLDDASQGWGAG